MSLVFLSLKQHVHLGYRKKPFMVSVATRHTRLLSGFWNHLGIRQSRGCQIILAIIGLTDVTSRLSACPSDYSESGQNSKLVNQGHAQPEWAAGMRHSRI